MMSCHHAGVLGMAFMCAKDGPQPAVPSALALGARV